MRNSKFSIASAILLCVAISWPAAGADSWPTRSMDLQNTGNAGHDAGLQTWVVRQLKLLDVLPTEGSVNGTPVISADGLLVTGDSAGFIYVFDTANGKRLLRIDSQSGGDDGADELGRPADAGVRSTALIATVTVPDGASSVQEERAYVAVSHATRTLYCLNLDKVGAERGTLKDDPGDSYFCSGPTEDPLWPLSLAASDSAVMNGSPIFSKAQSIVVGGTEVTRDVLYSPTTGNGCANAELWALDAHTGEIYWRFDPVVEGEGGAIEGTPAMSSDLGLLYVSTGACAGRVQYGSHSGSLVALDPSTGEVVWHHQRRVLDVTGFGISTSPLVANVDDVIDGSCRVVVSSDGDGCIYGFQQTADIPEPGGAGFDPLRSEQQRVLYRRCFVPGAPGGGFDLSNLAFDGSRIVTGQASGFPTPHVGADNANAFALDACTGRVEWASTTISNGRADAATVNGMLFQLGGTRTSEGLTPHPPETVEELQVVLTYSDFFRVPEVLATVDLAPHRPTLGGGGPAIVNGKIYTPTASGIARIGVDPGSNASPPVAIPEEQNVFAGSYLYPVSPGASALPDPLAYDLNPADRGHPYPLMVDKCIEENGTYRTNRALSCAEPFLYLAPLFAP